MRFNNLRTGQLGKNRYLSVIDALVFVNLCSRVREINKKIGDKIYSENLVPIVEILTSYNAAKHIRFELATLNVSVQTNSFTTR